MMMRAGMWLVFLHGPPGVGKLTVGRELQRLTRYHLFHNHLVVDLLESVFEFGSPPFIELREQIWVRTFREAARHDISLIFTFAPERTVRERFPADAEEAVKSEGGRVLFVSLTCPEQELEQRLQDSSRSAFKKLTSPKQYRELRAGGAFEFPKLRADLEIDTGSLSPKMAAERICARLV
jgi:chloramphenicol 3-O-phosphotransferase